VSGVLKPQHGASQTLERHSYLDSVEGNAEVQITVRELKAAGHAAIGDDSGSRVQGTDLPVQALNDSVNARERPVIWTGFLRSSAPLLSH
jgi:hypothetical protein